MFDETDDDYTDTVVKFEYFTMRYKPDAEEILRCVSFSIKEGDKVIILYSILEE